MRKIIAFGHKQQTGKSTSANYLAKKYPSVLAYGSSDARYFIVDNFAHSLKLGIGECIFGLSEEQLTDPILKETIDSFWGMTPRKILQLAGTEAMRNTFSQDIWIKTLQRRLMIADTNIMFAVDDVRFPDEADAIKFAGGITVRVDRATGSKSTHASETAMLDYNKWDYVIDNNGSIEDLYTQLDKIAEEYIGK